MRQTEASGGTKLWKSLEKKQSDWYHPQVESRILKNFGQKPSDLDKNFGPKGAPREIPAQLGSSTTARS